MPDSKSTYKYRNTTVSDGVLFDFSFKPNDFTSDINVPEDIVNIEGTDYYVVSYRRTTVDAAGSPTHLNSSEGGIGIYEIINGNVAFISKFKDVNLIGAMSFLIEGDYIYLASLRNPRIFIIDISTITAPTKVGELDLIDYVGADAVHYKVAKKGDFLYTCYRATLGTPDTSRVVTLDISDPTTPVKIQNLSSTGWAYYLFESNGFVYVTYFDFNNDPNKMEEYTIQGNGTLSLTSTHTDTGLNGIHHFKWNNRVFIIEWLKKYSLWNTDSVSLNIDNLPGTIEDVNTRVGFKELTDSLLVVTTNYTKNNIGLMLFDKQFNLLKTDFITNSEFSTTQALCVTDTHIIQGSRFNGGYISGYKIFAEDI